MCRAFRPTSGAHPGNAVQLAGSPALPGSAASTFLPAPARSAWRRCRAGRLPSILSKSHVAPPRRCLNACAELNAEGARVHTVDAFSYLAGEPELPFQLVFLDPPYADDSVAELCRLLEPGPVACRRGHRLFRAGKDAGSAHNCPTAGRSLTRKKRARCVIRSRQRATRRRSAERCLFPPCIPAHLTR